MEVPIGPALVIILTLGCASAQDRFFISAPNVFHLGVKEKVFVQMGASLLNRPVTLYLEAEHDAGRLMSDRVTISCSTDQPIKTVELSIDREKMAQLAPYRGTTPYLMLVAECNSFPEVEKRRVKQTRVLLSKHRGYIFIQTDQPIYTPLQKVRYRIFTLDHTMRPHQEPFLLSITNVAGNRIMDGLRLANGGILSDSFNIPDVSEMGTWKIMAHYEGDDSKSSIAIREFKVEKFVMPSFEVNIQSEQSYVLLSAERLDFTIKALYSYGKKVNGSYQSRVGVMMPGSDEGPKVKPAYIRGMEIAGSIQHGEARYNLSTAKLNEHLKKQVKMELSDLEQSGAQLYVAVSVTDIYSGELQEADVSLPVVSHRYTIDWSRTRSHFIPGVPLDVAVVVRLPNGSPAAGVAVHVNVPTSGEKARQAETNQQGVVFSAFNLHSPTSNNNPVDVEVTVDGQLERKVIRRAASSSNSYLYMSISSDIQSVGQQLTVTFQVINGQPQDGKLYYMVISRGVLVKHGSLPSGLSSKALVQITADMVPSFRVIGYYYHSNGDVVADSGWVDVKDECEGKLKVTSSQHNFEPGKMLKLKIDLEGQRAKVALLAVDKAIYALKANNKLTAKQVFSSMMTYDLGCSYSGGSNMVSTLNDAGLAFLSPSASQQSVTRTGFGCESRPTRNRRSLELRQALQNLKSNYTDETLQKCCSSGFERIPMTRTCDERAQRVSQLNTDACTEAFLECCRKGEELRERRKQEIALRGFNRDQKELEIEEFFDESTDYIRRYFPPSFAFTDLDVNGEQSLSWNLPDSITTWEIQAVSLSATHGFCVAEPYEFKVLKKIFVSLRLPYSVRRYEQIAIEPVIYNYMEDDSEPVEIAVHMAQTPGLCSPGSATSTSFVNITVQPQSSQLVSFSAVPMETGEIPVKIRLYSITQGWGSDAIEKMLKVTTEGIVEREEVGAKTVKLDGRTSTMTIHVDGRLPSETVPDSSSNIFIKMEGTGDGFGESTARTLLSPEGVAGLLRLPHGCAEQTMKRLAPTAIALRYLDAGQLWHQLPPGTRDKAFNSAQEGYMRILTYKKPDGSYGAWLTRPSSYWLTGLVVKVLSMLAERQTVRQEQGQATQFVSLEEISLSARHLVSVQSQDGSFNDPHPVLHREMQGGMGGKEQEASMTAFITIALQRSLDFIRSYHKSEEQIITQAENSISQSLSYLLRHMDGLQRPYAVALTAYCFALCRPDSQDAAIAWKKLQKLATELDKDGCRSWTASATALREEVVQASWARTPPAEAVSVETTAYALLTAVARKDTAWAKSAACWLTSQENYGGGFKSTQDTIIALEALSEYDLSRTTPPEPTNMDIRFSVTGKSDVVRLALREPSDKVETELKKLIGNQITMQLTGVGETKIRLVKVYHLMEPKDKCGLLSIQVKVVMAKGKIVYTDKIEENYDEYEEEDYQSDDGGAAREEPGPASAMEWFDARTRRRRDTQQSLSSTNTVDYEVCISHSLSRNLTGMAIADIRLLSGFEALTTDLEKLKDTPEQYISHYEVNQGRVVLYFNELMSPRECVTFGAVQHVPVGLLQPAVASVYDYYEPDRKCTVFYSAPHRSKMVSKLCSGDVCQCAERPCHKEMTLLSGAKTKGKDERRQRHACYHPTVDYGFIVDVFNVTVKSNFELYTTRVVELLRANQDTLVKVGDTRVFAKRLQCKAKLDTGKQYLIMGKDGKTTDSRGKMQYLLESNTWIEKRPGTTLCQKTTNKRPCRWFDDFVREYQTNGCRQ